MDVSVRKIKEKVMDCRLSPPHYQVRCRLTLFVLLLFTVLIPFHAAQASLPRTQVELLQFRASGHVLGFEHNSVYVAGGDHVLKVEFAGTTGGAPTAGQSTEGENGTQPLKQVSYRDLWPGVDLIYEATTAGIVESTWRIAAGAAPEQISLRYNAPVKIASDGSLQIHYGSGWMRESAPIAWQQIDAHRIPVQVAFNRVETANGEEVITFELGQYDTSYPVLIDPVLEWYTHLGSAGTDAGHAIAVDSAGNIYVAGTSEATWGTPARAYGGGLDAFVAKLDADGSLLWNTFLGSSSTVYGEDDYGHAITLDGIGGVYVAGTSGASWGGTITHSGNLDAFVAKVQATNGSLVWNTFMGSASIDRGRGIVADAFGNTYVVGMSWAAWGAPLRAYQGDWDAFVAKLNNVGQLQWNTFLGSGASEEGYAIALDSSSNIYTTGYSYATWGVPLTPHYGWNNCDVFVAKLNNTGALQWNTFMGASGYDEGRGIAVDGSGNVFITGYAEASWGTPINAHAGGQDAFAAKLDTDGARQWHTFMGATPNDRGNAITIDGSGNVYVAGYSRATWGIPIYNYVAGDDAFTAKLNAAGALQWNLFRGSFNNDSGEAIAAYGASTVYLAGYSSASLGLSSIRAYAGGWDAFVIKIDTRNVYTVSTSAPAGEGSFTPTSRTVTEGDTTTLFVTAEPGYSIATVSGCDGTWTGTSPYTTGNITGDCTVTANFTLNSYTVSTSAPASEGSFSPPSQTVNYGETTSFTVTAEPGYAIDNVSGCSGSWTGSNPYTTGSITGDCTVIANFVQVFTVDTSAAAGQGTFTPTSRSVSSGGTTTFTVSAESGYAIDTVSGCSGNWTGSNPYTTGIISGDCTVTATFTLNSYTVSTSAPASEGSFSPTSQTVNHGETTSFTVTAESGYAIDTVSGCDGTWTGSNPYVTGTIGDDCTVMATFTLNSYTVSTSAPASEGSFSPTSQTVNHGETTSFTVTAESGYTIDTVSGCDGTWTGNSPYTTGTITGDCTVVAGFSLNSYTVMPSAGANGSISPVMAQIVDYGSTTSFTVTADPGYWASVGGTCGGTLVGDTYTTATITGDCTVTVEFKEPSPFSWVLFNHLLNNKGTP